MITDELKKTAEPLLRKHRIPHDASIFRSDAVTVTTDDGVYYVIILANKLCYNTIAHELFHLTKAITTHRCIEEEESQAWVMGFLMETFMDIVKKKKLVLI